MEEQYSSIERSIQEILNTLNHPMYSSQNGEPPYSQLPEESVRLLNKQLKCLRESLAEREDERKEELKLAGLKEFIIPHEIKISRNEPKWLEHIWLEPTRFEPIWFEHILLEPTRLEPTRLEPILLEPILLEPKLLKTRPHKRATVGDKQTKIQED